ncbi:ArsR/SmtB family transcription factor [Nitratidesulfovibrio sp. SRB-5]|uniref:ArsR/SmtB family transcription factor n=1 Tax=Nitratidesulfovibrio sp. SRB-5 TaxID=2872636 RepID=UPI00102552C5|nr:metalloregulator ArsR/SmtB family transcription factor [Nitratidesulfovibrio sp. SRB-5]MBZ2170753.1 metalloregulator ArsR/SmtB family transcription factor [Nitratidesulfovibrio sp. SRB-5]RXF75993.1 methyltransferase domain-containing protein [Desulfovibrio sp. DS-1]
MSAALDYFKALSDDTRMRLMHVLNKHELNVNELVSILEMGQSRVSRHLKILTGAGLLVSRRDGLWVFYAAPAEGEGRDFLDAVAPFIAEDMTLQGDMAMAEKIIEERALKTRQFFNAIAEDWDELNREVLGGFDLAGAVADAMPAATSGGSDGTPGCRVAVDLGCGTGTVLERMLPRAQEVIGVDGSPRMLEMARRRLADAGQRVSLRIGELDHLPLRDGEADFASINMVLHHLSEPVAALREIGRTLRTGGLLFLSDFDHHDNERMRTDYGDRWLGFDRAALTARLSEAGFAVRRADLREVSKGLSLHLIVAEKS